MNTARGELIDEAALADAIESGHVAGAGARRVRNRAADRPAPDGLPQVVATPHIAASTTEAQELVGVEIALSVRDYLGEGLVRNAVNFPSVAPEEFPRVRPYLRLAEMLGSVVAQLAARRVRNRSASATTARSSASTKTSSAAR